VDLLVVTVLALNHYTNMILFNSFQWQTRNTHQVKSSFVNGDDWLLMGMYIMHRTLKYNVKFNSL